MLSLGIIIQLLEFNVSHTKNKKTNSLSNSNNNNNNKIFDWVIQKCFSSTQEIADLCFIALAKVYMAFDKDKSTTDFPDTSYFDSVLAITLLNIGSSRLNIHETSISLLRVLNKVYLTKTNVSKEEMSPDLFNKVNQAINKTSKASTLSVSSPSTTRSSSSIFNQTDRSRPEVSPQKVPSHADLDIINSMVVYSKSQIFISEYVALKNPEQTMFLFCQLTSRFEHCMSHSVRRSMLNILVP